MHGRRGERGGERGGQRAYGDADQWYLSRPLFQTPSTYGGCCSDVANGSPRRCFALTRLLLVQTMHIHSSPQIGFAHCLSTRLMSLPHILPELLRTHSAHSSRGCSRGVGQGQGVPSSRNGCAWILVPPLPGHPSGELPGPQGNPPRAKGTAYCNVGSLQSYVRGSQGSLQSCVTHLEGLIRTSRVLGRSPQRIAQASVQECSRYRIG